MDEIVQWYNHHRLYSSVGYVTPAAMHFGDADRIQQERRTKLAQARQRRKEENLKLRQRSLALGAGSGELQVVDRLAAEARGCAATGQGRRDEGSPSLPAPPSYVKDTFTLAR